MAAKAITQSITHNTGKENELDENLRKVLPPGCKLLSSVAYGTAAWTRASRIVVSLEDGREKSYFLKCASEDLGKQMINGEYVSICEIYKHKPALTATPIAKGQLKHAAVPTYFFLMEFLDITTGAPEPSRMGSEIADLHAKSMSPNGKFGFHMVTYHGPHPQILTWEDSWAVFFCRLLKQFYKREMATNGPSGDGKYEMEFERLFNSTVFNLLEPLQSSGRHLHPCLVHGDMWEENCGTEMGTGQPKIFDAAVFYAHNEYELGMWRRPSIRFTKAHFRNYLKHMAPSEPKEQWDDRIRLYSLKFELAHSMGWAGAHTAARESILRDLMYLNQRYGDAATAGAHSRE